PALEALAGELGVDVRFLGELGHAELLLTWGPLSKPQQVEVLVRALTLVQEPWRSRVRLEVAGDGPERPALEALAGELGVDVRFLGELGHAELRAKMRECSLYLHAAAHNPEALGVLDAMSVGCPVVLANQPGVAEFVENGVNGIRVDATADAFAYAISGMLPDEDWRETLSACASQQIRSRSSLERVGGLLAEAHGAALELAGHATASRAIA
ncbi:MAG: glycosyltransferase, partial [Planctomycetota bacterium]